MQGSPRRQYLINTHTHTKLYFSRSAFKACIKNFPKLRWPAILTWPTILSWLPASLSITTNHLCSKSHKRHPSCRSNSLVMATTLYSPLRQEAVVGEEASFVCGLDVVAVLGLTGIGSQQHCCLRRAVDLIIHDGLLHLQEEHPLQCTHVQSVYWPGKSPTTQRE